MTFSVGILLATYNGEKNLLIQLASIQSQVEVDVHIFISDDLSSDSTPELLKVYVDSHPNVFLFENYKKFNSPGHNFFSLLDKVALENLDYIFYSDQDDIWFPDKAIHSIRCIIDMKVNCYASSLYAWNDIDGSLKLLEKDQKPTTVDYLFQSASAGCTYCLCKDAAITLKKVLATGLAISPSVISHDWISYAVTRSYGFEWVIDSIPRILYRQHGSNAYGANNGVLGFLKRFRLIKNGWYSESLVYVASLCLQNEENKKFINTVANPSFKNKCFLVWNFPSLRRKKIEALLFALVNLIDFKFSVSTKPKHETNNQDS
jgi:rhamnosyltransferase